MGRPAAAGRNALAPPPAAARAGAARRAPQAARPAPFPARPQFDHVLGRGAFKVVYKAFDTQEGASRAARKAAQRWPTRAAAARLLLASTDARAALLVPQTPLHFHCPAPTQPAGTEVAWNQVRVSEVMSAKDAENKEERDRLFAEIRVLKALKHKNIMSFYDSWYDPKTYTVNFITELFTSGTLRQ